MVWRKTKFKHSIWEHRGGRKHNIRTTSRKPDNNENDNNTVDVVFDFKLGEKAYIKPIQFIGEKIYKDRVLRGVIASEEDKFWKFISTKRFINPELINLDKRLLEKFYLNKGYYNVNINSFIGSFNSTSRT